MTNSNMCERFEPLLQKYIDNNERNWNGVTIEDVFIFIEQEINTAREEGEKKGESNLKQRVQNLIDDNDDYILFIEQFKQL